ncbi:Ribosomal protein L34Ae [Artemisia annua]|uniref:Ribosomal protein L34Ae n=1 Tax=Artemisia annua TaxID=35608 RepID=A0A2U1MLT2_ARTAN|nr:Ribosomal protein L34Ae [Artemisia annua]
MVCFHSAVPVSHHMNMANHQSQKTSKRTPISTCEQSLPALIDVFILIAVISSCGFLIYPYVKLLLCAVFELVETVMFVVKDEVLDAPMIYGCLGLSIFSASMAVLAITLCTSNKCGKPGCRGLHKAAEFDIQLETDNSLSHSSSANGASNVRKIGLRKGLFELPRDYHKELEAELKKMAPVNGRAVLVFRARCGCSVGRLEVHGPKKNNKKIKK